MSYNGWSNKETWLVNLWLGEAFTMDQESGAEITADYIEQMVEECVSEAVESDCGFIVDLLNCALGEIDYHEIAKHFVEEDA